MTSAAHMPRLAGESLDSRSKDGTRDVPSPAVEVLSAEQVIAAHGTRVWRTLRYLGVADADLDDACQEVFIVVCKRLADFEGRSAITTWLHGICLRVAAAHRRKAHRRREVPSASLTEAMHSAPTASHADAEGPERAVHHAQRVALLDRALDELPEAQREVFVLYEIEQLSMKEVASALGCPLQTAYSRHKAAQRKIIAFAECQRDTTNHTRPPEAFEEEKRR